LISKSKQRVVIVDFNVAKKVKEGEILLMYTKSAGTLAFAAPERLVDNCVYSEKVDMWAAGIVLFMLLTGSHPFETSGSTF
jgi:serine/threonine protein kinase